MFLVHFVHEHLPFRWPEFEALTERFNCHVKLISTLEQVQTRPYILVEAAEEEALIEAVKESYLVKSLYELWGHSKSSIDDLSIIVSKSKQFLSGKYGELGQEFRVNCESYGTKISQSTKIDWIQRMEFMNSFQCKPDLKNPVQTYCIFEVSQHVDSDRKEYYFGRQIAVGDRSAVTKFSLKSRTFIANTSMDPHMSLIMANVGCIKPNDLVYDPFVGSGSLLVAAAHKGAYVLGADIDWLLLHGKSRPSRKNETLRKDNESVLANMQQYNLQDRYLDVLIADMSRSPVSSRIAFDAILTDPPYGVRECCEKIGYKKNPREWKNDNKIRFPSKIAYTMEELLKDLLCLSANHLSIGARLVYYLPVCPSNLDWVELIPRHSCLELVSWSDQELAGKLARLLVVMKKIREPHEGGHNVHIPSKLLETNFRDAYFSKGSSAQGIKNVN